MVSFIFHSVTRAAVLSAIPKLVADTQKIVSVTCRTLYTSTRKGINISFHLKKRFSDIERVPLLHFISENKAGNCKLFLNVLNFLLGRDRAVGITTRCGLDGPRI